MTRMFLIEKRDHNYLAVETTQAEAKAQFAPITQFPSWEKAEEFFGRLGVTSEQLAEVKHRLEVDKISQLIIP